MNIEKIYMTGAQSTGKLHLGNLIGSILNIGQFANEKNHKILIMAADLHALTTNSIVKYEDSLDLLRYYHAVCPQGLFYIQSEYHQITYLSWILSTYATMGKLSQMTQYKSKQDSSNNFGLLTYPILMAADILITRCNYVPVGEDQNQHLEFTRDIVKKFNQNKTNKLTIPQTILCKIPKVFDLQNPEKKMSKSNNSKGTIFLTDGLKTITKKIKSAKTDALLMPIKLDNNRSEVNKLIDLYVIVSGKTHEDIYQTYGNGPTSKFKIDLAYHIHNFIKKYQPNLSRDQMIERIKSDKQHINQIFNQTIQMINQQIIY